MIIVDTALARRQAEGRPIRVGMIGAGFQASGIALQIMTATQGMTLCAVANRNIAAAVGVFDQAGIQPTRCDSQAALEDAIRAGRAAVTEDAEALALAEGLDAIIEVTGSIEFAARAVLARRRIVAVAPHEESDGQAGDYGG